MREEARRKWRVRERTGHRALCYTLSLGFCCPKQTERGSHALVGRVSLGGEWAPSMAVLEDHLGGWDRFPDLWPGCMLTIRSPCFPQSLHSEVRNPNHL